MQMISSQMFGSKGRRKTTIRGELGLLEFDSGTDTSLRLTAQNSDVTQFNFTKREGGHDGKDPMMISRFIHAIRTGDAGESCLEAGLNCAIIAFKADESRLCGQTLDQAYLPYRLSGNS